MNKKFLLKFKYFFNKIYYEFISYIKLKYKTNFKISLIEIANY